jgi:DNA repair protein RadC
MRLAESTRLVLAGDEDQVPTQDLLALVLRSSPAASHLLGRFGSLGTLEEAAPPDLLDLPGVGPKRAAAVRAVLTLARRRGSEPAFRGRPIGCSRDVYELLAPLVRHERREVLVLLALDARHRMVRSPIIAAVGSLTGAAIEPRDLLRPLIVATAAAAVLAHNHPSTCPEPSAEDETLSRTLFESCALVGIRLLDHVVIGDGGFVSLADRGLL